MLNLSAPGTAVTIPAFTEFRTLGNPILSFYTRQDYFKSASEDSIDMFVYEGSLVEVESFTPSGQLEIFTETIGVDISSFYVFDGTDVWDRKDFSDLNQDLSDKWYEVYINHEGHVRIEFNPNIDLSPYEFQIKYQIASGADGNIGADRINFSPVIENVTVNNPEGSNGGTGEELDSSIRRNALDLLKAFFTGVTETDIEVVTRVYPGVAKAYAAHYRRHNEVPLQQVDVYIVPDDLSVPSAAFIALVDQFLDDRSIVTMHTEIKAPNYVPIDITMEIFLSPGFIFSDVENNIRAILDDYFSLQNQDLEFGKDIFFSNILALAQGVQGVSYINLTEPSTNVPIAFNEFPTQGTVTITLGS